MKRLLITALATLSLGAAAHEPYDKKLVFVGNTSFSSFCKAAIKDDVTLMRRSFSKKVGVIATSKSGVYELLLSEENLSCNGKGIVAFSKERNAEQVLSFLNSVNQKGE